METENAPYTEQDIASLYEHGVDIPEPTGPYDGFTSFDGRGLSYDPIEVLTEIREGVADLPEYVTTFAPGRVIDSTCPNKIPTILFELGGSWPIPSDRFSGGSRQYVNPNADDAWLYNDCYVTCECGAIVTTAVDNRWRRDELPGRTSHGDDCKQIYRWRSRLQLWERRRATLVRMLRLDRHSMEIGQRLGYKSNRLSGQTSRHDVTISEERDVAKRKVAVTAVEFLDRYSVGELSTAFGYSDTALREMISEYHPDPPDLHEKYMERVRSGCANSLPSVYSNDD